MVTAILKGHMISVLLIGYLCLSPGAHAGATISDGQTEPRETIAACSDIQNQVASLNPRVELHGSISITQRSNAPAEAIEELLCVASARDARMQALNKTVDRHRYAHKRLWALAKDAANFVISYRGYSPSSEGGDIILGEKSKLKSLSAAEYQHQKLADEAEIEIVASIFQIANGLGMQDRPEGQAEIDQAMQSLKSLAGGEKASAVLHNLRRWSAGLIVQKQIYREPVWGIKQRREKLRAVLLALKDRDPVIKEIVDRVHRYNGRSKRTLATARLVKTSLGLAGLAPSFVGTASQTALFTFVMLTGGTEEDKLLKELYLDKRLDSRSRVLSETAHMALESYQIGRLTGNGVLLSCSESVLTRLCGSKAQELLSAARDSQRPVVPLP